MREPGSTGEPPRTRPGAHQQPSSDTVRPEARGLEAEPGGRQVSHGPGRMPGVSSPALGTAKGSRPARRRRAARRGGAVAMPPTGTVSGTQPVLTEARGKNYSAPRASARGGGRRKRVGRYRKCGGRRRK